MLMKKLVFIDRTEYLINLKEVVPCNIPKDILVRVKLSLI